MEYIGDSVGQNMLVSLTSMQAKEVEHFIYSMLGYVQSSGSTVLFAICVMNAIVLVLLALGMISVCHIMFTVYGCCCVSSVPEDTYVQLKYDPTSSEESEDIYSPRVRQTFTFQP